MTRRRPEIFSLDEVEEGETAPAREADPPRRRDNRPEGLTEAKLPKPARRRSDRTESAAPAAKRERAAPKKARRTPRGWSWLGLFLAGATGLAGLAFSVALYGFVEDLLTRIPWLGGVAAILAAMTVVGLLGMGLREWIAMRRLKEVEGLRARADKAVAANDRQAAMAVANDLCELYADRPQTARGRTALKAHMREIIDGRDLVGLGEREVLARMDRDAIGAIVTTSRRVAAVTALSPRALVDVAFVLFAALSLVRKIATIYGGRPGTLGFFRVLRHAVAHLAVTGGMAAGDTMVGEVIGRGIAARLSAKLGEGIVNGLMTARLGLATLDVLRPLPFVATRRPRVNDIVSEIAKVAPSDKNDKNDKEDKNDRGEQGEPQDPGRQGS